MNEMKQLFKNKTYVKLLFASFTSKLGSFVGTTALLFYLLKEYADNPNLATLTEVIYILPILFFFFLFGVITDAYDRQKVANLSDIFSFILSLILILAIQWESLPFVFLLLFIRKLAQSFFEPVESALFQGILKEEDYTANAGINQFLYGFLSLAEKAIGIAVFWWVGVEGAVLIDAISFLISFLLIRSCKFEKEVLLPNGEGSIKKVNLKEIWEKYKEGIVYIKNHSLLPSLMFIFVIFGLLTSCFAILPLFLLKYEIAPKSYEQVAIYEGIAIGLGYLVGGAVFTTIANKVKNLTLMSGGLFFLGLITVGVGYSPNIIIFLLFMFGVTFFLTAVNVGVLSLMPSVVDPQLMGRVRGCILPIVTLSSVLSYLVITALFPRFLSADLFIAVIGSVMALVGAYYWFRLRKWSKEQSSK